MIRHVYFSGIENKYIDNILNFAQDICRIEGAKTETIIQTQYEKCRILIVVVNYILMTIILICVK